MEGVPTDPSLLLPHRRPFLFLDRVGEIDPGRRATGWKTVTAVDCRGGRTWPPIFLVEVMAQTSAIALFPSREAAAGRIGLLAGIPEMTFRRPARPGETIVATADRERHWGDISRFRVRVLVGEELLAHGALLLATSKEG